MNATAQLPFQPHQGNAGAMRAFVLAVVVHGLLFTFLYFGIRWQSKPPEPASADLWGALPPMSAPSAAPPAPEPPPVVEEPPQPVEPRPTPTPPDIRIKEAPKKPESAKKAELPKPVVPPKKTEPTKIAPKPLPSKGIFASEAAKELNDFSKNSIADAASKDLATLKSGAAGRAARTWGDRVAALIRSKVPVSVADAVPGNPTAVFEVTLLPGREVGLVKLVKSSGNPAYDDAARRAIQAISPLPPFAEGMEAQRTFELKARPKDQ
jgi:colicin import membrane protein